MDFFQISFISVLFAVLNCFGVCGLNLNNFPEKRFRDFLIPEVVFGVLLSLAVFVSNYNLEN